MTTAVIRIEYCHSHYILNVELLDKLDVLLWHLDKFYPCTQSIFEATVMSDDSIALVPFLPGLVENSLKFGHAGNPN